MTIENKPIIVIGGGAAGILAAWRAAQVGAKVILYEKNKKLGIKLLISGGGKCNITHSGSIGDVQGAFLQTEGRFLKPSLYRFTNEDILGILRSEGVESFVRPNGRVFPVSGRADDVVDALGRCLDKSGVEVRLNATVESIFRENSSVTGIRVDGKLAESSHIILTTGGVSYPKTGTTGDGFIWASQLGHTIVPLRAALAPITVTPLLPVAWRGIALRDGELAVYVNNKRVFGWKDDILFTHEGVSGPAALEVSRKAAECVEENPVELWFDFLPAKEFVDVDRELLSMIESHPDRIIQSHVEAWMPNRIVPVLLDSIKVDPATRGYRLSRDERKSVVSLLKSWRIGKVERINIERGEVTAGGIALAEVYPQTMRSRKIGGLYVAGEVLDIAGPVGGYNLQAAFSTGYVAGETAAKDWLLHSRRSENPANGVIPQTHIPTTPNGN